MITYKIKIAGRVQGVGFRWFLRRKAKELGIRGYAENLQDGTVEVIAQVGDEDKNLLNNFLTECKKGPFLAKVDKIVLTKGKENRTFSDFQIK